MKSDFNERREARVERMREMATKHKAEAERRFQAAHNTLDMIPPGQPILVGHHSEKRHRRDLARIDSNFAKGAEASKKADYYRDRAASAESNKAIFSDDPNATEKLEDKIARLEKRQEMMVAANKLVRKQDREGLAAMGYSEKAIENLFTPDFCGHLGYPDYATKNNNANIRRLKQRLAQ